MHASLRWKNGDRQIIDAPLISRRPRDEVLWKVWIGESPPELIDLTEVST